MNTLQAILGGALGVIATVVLLWAMRILPIVRILAKVFKFKNNSKESDVKRYEFCTRYHSWLLESNNENRESIRYSSVYGSWLQLSNYFNIPFSWSLWNVRIFSLYRGFLIVWLRSLKRTKPLKSVTSITMYQCDESQLRKLPSNHPFRAELELALRRSIRESIRKARTGDVSSARNLWKALISRTKYFLGFSSFISRVGILVGKRECHLIGMAVCKEMNFTAEEAMSLIPFPSECKK